MENQLINLDDIREFWPISQNLQPNEIDPYIKRAQQSDLVPILGEPLYFDLVDSFVDPLEELINETPNVKNSANEINPDAPTSNVQIRDWDLESKTNSIPPTARPSASGLFQSKLLVLDPTDELIVEENEEIFFDFSFQLRVFANGNANIYGFLYVDVYGMNDSDQWELFAPGFTPTTPATGWLINKRQYFNQPTPIDDIFEIQKSGISPKKFKKWAIVLTIEGQNLGADWTIGSTFSVLNARVSKGGFAKPENNLLFYGGTYEYKDETIFFRGIRPLLCAFSFGRVMGYSKTHVVRGGVVVKDIDESDPQIDSQIRVMMRSANSEALRLESQLLQFLTENKTQYPLFDKRELKDAQKRTGFDFWRIGRQRGFNYLGTQRYSLLNHRYSDNQ